jgi:phosphate transport system permease protein
MSRTPPDLSNRDDQPGYAPDAMLRASLRNKLVDRGAEWLIAIGGLGVIAAVLLIAFFLIYEVVPLFQSARIAPLYNYQLPMAGEGSSLYLATDEQGDLGFRLTATGAAVFFSLSDGKTVLHEQLPLGEGVTITRVAVDAQADGLLALGTSTGEVLVLRDHYAVSYPQNQRRVTPSLEFPMGRKLLDMGVGNVSLTALAVRDNEALLLVGQAGDKSSALLVQKQAELSAQPLKTQALALPVVPPAREILVSADQHWLYFLDRANQLHVLLQRDGVVVASQVAPLGPARVQTIGWLSGGQSLLSLADDGRVTQWFMVRDPDLVPRTYQLQSVRQFAAGDKPLALLSTQERGKGFFTLDTTGELSIFHATAARRVLQAPLTTQSVGALAIAPRADRLLVETADQRLAVWGVDNRHADVSFSALWGKVWYEGYPEPAYVWQSSAASNDFEPKLSLVPLVYGTLKAALYAMLIAAPLALGGAIFTAYFMAPAMRARVKPLIELMEAMPTVILGFLAGLWLAPFMAGHMLGILILLLLLPVVTLLTAMLWHLATRARSSAIPQGWQAAVLLPVIVLSGYLCFYLSPLLEKSLFGGDFVLWLTQDLGVDFDQRNALVVGIAMGFAVIPSIFSIAEDAIFSVPRHLTMGSLALGASPWRTLVGVVLPTAAAAIVSALIIGFGRAIGETMIVLMATGNTPIMEANIFEGMRTLAANMAVEVPEAEVNSTHYRVLMLAAFVLFCMTFVFNTVAELLRQRLRSRYSAL